MRFPVWNAFGIICVRMVSVRLVRRCDHDSGNPVDPDSLEDVECWNDIVFKRTHRRVRGIADDRRRRQVKYGIDLVPVTEFLNACETRKIRELDIRHATL